MGKSDTLSARVLKTMSIFSGVRMMHILCSILRAKFISLWIGPAGVGLFAVFNNAIEMLSSTTQLNMRDSAVRDIANTPAQRLPQLSGVIRWWAWRLGLLGLMVMLVLSPLLSGFSFGSTEMWWAFAVLSVCLLFAAVTAGEQALLQGTGRFKALAKCSVWGAVTGTACSIPLYYFFGKGSIVPSILIFSVAGMVAARIVSDVRHKAAPRDMRIAVGRSFLTLGAYMSLSTLATTGASYLLLSYITNRYGETATGIYQAGYAIVINYIGIVFLALSMEFFPRAVKVARRPGMASTVVSHEILLLLYVLTPMIVALVSVDRWLLYLLYSSDFYAAESFITIGCLSAIFRAISFCSAYVILARGDGRIYVVTETLSAAVGLALNITFFTRWSYAGLGLSYVLWYFIYTIITGAVYYRRYGMRLSRGAVRCSVAAVAFVAAAIIVKSLAWWAPLCVLPVACVFSYKGLIPLLKRH